MKLITEGLLLPILLLALMIADVGQPGKPLYVLVYWTTVLYIPLLIRKSVLRFRATPSLTTRIFSVTVTAIGISLFAESIASLSNTSLLPRNLHYALILFVSLVDISGNRLLSVHHFIHPAVSFVGTFAGFILLGALLLLLPNATTNGISFIDALFTSTSAVCVTGLAVLDTGKDFTLFGQTIIMLLIQVGGLGVLAFTNLFGILFKGQKTFRDILFLRDLVSADNLRGTFHHLVRIVLFVIAIEAVGAALIFSIVPEQGACFAVCHSISSFCNAGFSTLTNSLYEPVVRYEYLLHLVIAALFIVGGLGYNVFFNVYEVYKYKARLHLHHWQPMVFGKPSIPKHQWGLNTTIVLWTTLVLIVVGTVIFWLLEYNNTLAEHSWYGKWVTAFFGAVTPRTAGYNSINTADLLNPTVMVCLLLMWIGASPGSTGGGIKTTAFAIATLNLWNTVLGRERLTMRFFTIPESIVGRIMAIISLSLIAIGLSVCLMISFQPELPVLKVAFESFSAYGTVGLSMGITAQLSVANKIVIICLMFLGRVSFLTFLVALFSSLFPKNYHEIINYPDAKIFVN